MINIICLALFIQKNTNELYEKLLQSKHIKLLTPAEAKEKQEKPFQRNLEEQNKVHHTRKHAPRNLKKNI